MGKYDPLKWHLDLKGDTELVMTFQEIESIIGASLPPSARTYGAWWANHQYGTQCRSWLANGYKVGQIDFVRERVVLRRDRSQRI